MSSNVETEKKQCFILFSRSVDRNARKLARQFRGRVDFLVLTYDDKGTEKDETIDGIRHVVYNRESLSRLFHISAPKFKKENWAIMPGNLDLCHLLFVWQNPTYSYYWFCEDDVRYTGNFPDFIGQFEGICDELIATNYRDIYPGWWHQRSYVSPEPNSMSPKTVFLPFFRISKDAAKLIVNAYGRGWSGHHEISWPSILRFHGKKITDLNTLVEDCYTSSPHREGLGPGSFIYHPSKLFAGLQRNRLYHPVKPFNEYARRTATRVKHIVKNSVRMR